MTFAPSPRRTGYTPVTSFDYGSLEPRQLLSISLNQATAELTLYGTLGNDQATVSFADAMIQAQVNGASQSFAASAVQHITFYGYGGNDVFTNQTAISSLTYGGDGDDFLVGGTASDELIGGNGNDTIHGGAGTDNLVGNGGVDTVRGNEGADIIYGGDDQDYLYGDDNDDFVSGGNGNDWIEGGNGADTLSGNAGIDTQYGNGGDDIVYGGHQNDQIFGNDGHDRLFGYAGDDTLDGGHGDDFLVGGIDNDTVFGSIGNDLLSGEAGIDVLHGEAGDDTFYGGDGDDQLNGGDDHDVASGGNGNDLLNGGLGNDLLAGNEGDDIQYSNAGNDQLYGGNGNDSLYGDAGSDNLYGQNGNDFLAGGSENDLLDGGAENDRLFGQSGADSLLGGSGDDGLFGGIGGGDQISGNDGSDRFMIWAGDVMLDRQVTEAQIEFRNETSNWNETEIEIIDRGLQWLQDQAQTALVIRDSLDTDPVIYSKWADLGGAVGINYLTTYYHSQTGYTYDREIQFLEWNENSSYQNEQAILTAIHEVGHSWDSVLEIENVLSGHGPIWTNFLAESMWTDSNPHSSQFLSSYDGQWWYIQDAVFAYDYGRTNPYEDWATIFEAAYDAESAAPVPGLAAKLAIFNQLMSAFDEA